MYSECLPFTRIPHATKLFTDYLYAFDRVSRFYSRPPRAATWLSEEAGNLRYDPERRERVAAVLERQNRGFGASQQIFDSIDRFRRGASVAVTGQQVGFLGGPLFSILKALTAVRVAAQATSNGVDCVPVFWLATEDHDFEEISSAVVQDADGALHTISLEVPHTPGAPMRDVRLDQSSDVSVRRAAELLGDSEIAELVQRAYKPGETVGSAFARLFATLFSEYGVILLDASDAELHQIAAPIYSEAIRRAEALDSAVLARGKELIAAGYHEQVKVTPSSTLLFGTFEGARVPIHRANGGFTVGTQKLTADDLLARIADDPAQFSPNVLLRPVVQDFILPTIAYSGGPAEVSYFAQAGVVYQQLLGRVTPILPRFSATIVDARAQRILERYKLSITDSFQGPDHVTELIASRSLPPDLQSAFDGATAKLDQALSDIAGPLKVLDPTLLEAASRVGNKMRYQLGRLHRRAANAELRRTAIVARHAAYLNSALFPQKDLQERIISGVSFLARYGMALLPSLYEAAEKDCPDHQIVYL